MRPVCCLPDFYNAVASSATAVDTFAAVRDAVMDQWDGYWILG